MSFRIEGRSSGNTGRGGLLDASRAVAEPGQNEVGGGRPVVGLTITVNSVAVAAQGAAMGFDFLWVEMEHSPVSLETLRQIVLATRGAGAVPFARVPKRVLDILVYVGSCFPPPALPNWRSKPPWRAAIRPRDAAAREPCWPPSPGPTATDITTRPTTTSWSSR